MIDHLKLEINYRIINSVHLELVLENTQKQKMNMRNVEEFCGMAMFAFLLQKASGTCLVAA